ncbi:MAG TPA: hypothetical protein VNO52_10760 [Methylomirabilota bacterium]|nr:hypothetical protein [Methylomirabilota bacterium]
MRNSEVHALDSNRLVDGTALGGTSRPRFTPQPGRFSRLIIRSGGEVASLETDVPAFFSHESHRM